MSLQLRDALHVTYTEVTFAVEVTVPINLCRRFAEAISGDEHDVFLDAERALRDRVPAPSGAIEEIEVAPGPRWDELRDELIAAHDRYAHN